MFGELASIEHAFGQTKAKFSEINLTGAVYAATPKEYIPILTMEESIIGKDLELEYLEEVMGKLCRHSGGKQGHLAVKTELVLNALQGSSIHVMRKVIGPTNALTKKQIKWSWEVWQKLQWNMQPLRMLGTQEAELFGTAENAENRPSGYKSTMQLPGTEENEFVLCAVDSNELGF